MKCVFACVSGSGFALSLIVNVEQYEYMKGPENDAGAKVNQHSSKLYNAVKDSSVSMSQHFSVMGLVQLLLPMFRNWQNIERKK